MQGLKVFFACALGALIGTLITLQLSPFLWWIGAISGFVVGYASYEVKKIVQAVKIAAREAFSWKLDKAKLNSFLNEWLLLLAIDWIVVMGNFIVPAAVFVLLHNPRATEFFFGFALGEFTFCQFFAAIKLSQKDAISKKEAIEICWKANPISFYGYWLPRAIFVSISWIAKKALALVVAIFTLVVKLPRFLWKIVILVHSDLRLLCGVDAFIGAGIGYFNHNALIGTLTGGIFGVINYYLVRKMVIKVVPERQS
jgi:hypothetical protein